MRDAMRAEGTSEPHGIDRGGDGHRWLEVTRRRFLQGAALGAVAIGAAYARGPRVLGADASHAPLPSPDPLLPVDLASVSETWTEPPVWRPTGTDQLRLNVVENTNGFRFSYGGRSPGPTIRMRGDQTLYVRIENDLSEDDGTSVTGPSPDPVEGYPGPEGALLQTLQGDAMYGEGIGQIPAQPLPDWSLGEHVNGVHAAHVTNLHTHGLHVASGRNDNGTSSDDIFLRIVPAADARRIAASPGLYEAYQEDRDEIIDDVGEFEFRLGNVMQGLAGPDGQALDGLPHPPGTYWYHPHSHGATQNQVASGMAGFLIIEGDVDALINERIAGDVEAAPDQPTGAWDYRERAMLVQRVFVAPTANVSGPSEGPDPDELKKHPEAVHTIVNGDADPDTIIMRPGAIERWRVLNGSVDGAGAMRLAVLVGEFTTDANGLLQLVDRSGDTPTLRPVTVNDYQPLSVTIDGASQPVHKADIWQLSWDGITLVAPDGAGGWAYQPLSLATVNGGQEPDFAGMAACFKAESMASCYRRPNELYMSDANRADILFQAPPLEDGAPAVYTIVSLPTQLSGTPETTSTIMAHVVVKGDAVPGDPAFPFATLLQDLAVHPYELPVGDDEVAISSDAERLAMGVGDGTAYRTRTLRYAGWGANGLPLVDAGADYAAQNPDKSKLTYYLPPARDALDYSMPVTSDSPPETMLVTRIERFPSGDLPTVLLPPDTRTMNINGEKFYPSSQTTPAMLVNTAEEWAVFNQSIDVYSVRMPDSSWTTEQLGQYLEQNPEIVYYSFEYVGDPPDGAPTSPQPYFGSHRYGYAMRPAQVAAVNKARQEAGGDPWTQKGPLQISGRAVDHPFHIHQNPFWLMRVDVPDENGAYVNILPQPLWSDTVAVPRNGGRVVFRSRFADYIGEFVNHCHILLHEDHGMMQRVQVVGVPADANYELSDAVASDVDDVNAVYPQPTLADSWQQSLLFVDANHSGQVYPGQGFVVEVPTPPSE